MVTEHPLTQTSENGVFIISSNQLLRRLLNQRVHQVEIAEGGVAAPNVLELLPGFWSKM